LGGVEAERIAAQFFAAPGAFFDEYIERCFPLYSRKAVGRATTGRIEVNLEVGAHFVSREWRTFDLFGDLGKIRAPTLMLAGDHDPITTLDDALEAFAALPESCGTFVRYPEAGHALLADVRDAVIEELRKFISVS
jgi:proline iminopeptidase